MFEAKSNEMSHITTISLSSEHAYARTRTHSHALARTRMHTYTHTHTLSLTLTQTKAYTIHQSTNRYFHQSGIILPKWPALALPHCGYTGLCQRPPFNSHVNSGQSHILWTCLPGSSNDSDKSMFEGLRNSQPKHHQPSCCPRWRNRFGRRCQNLDLRPW